LPGQTKATTIALHVSDRQVAEAKLHEIVRELEREAVGICTPRRVRLAGQCGIEQHVKAYCSDLRARRKDEDYVTTVEKRLIKLGNECQWQRIGDVTAESFQMWRERQRFAAKTLNDYLASASALFGWLIRNEIASRNPLARVGKVDVRGNERLKRRAFTPEEFASVIAVAGEYRLALLTAYYTGLRRGELSQLQWADVLHKAEGTFIIVRAETAKNRLTKALYVPRWFAHELERSEPAGAAEGDLILPAGKVPSIWAFRTLLKRAGVSYKDALGRQADFHAIRRSLNTHLAQNGVDPHTRKEIMRHSELRLTLDVYTDPTALPTVAAMEKLPIFAILQENAQIDAHNPDSAVHGVAHSGVATGEIQETQPVRNEKPKHALACVDTVSQDDEKSCLARIRT
jgi:integrase